MLSSRAPLSLSRSLPLLSLYLYLSVPYTLFCYIRTSLPLCLPTRFALCSLSASALSLRKLGASFFLKKLSHLLSIVAPTKWLSSPPIFKSPMDILAVRMPKRLCPLVLRPQRASADRLVGDKSNSVTLVAGVMLRVWQRASPSNRCQHCHCAPSPKPNIPSKAQQRGGEGEGGERMGQV